MSLTRQAQFKFEPHPPFSFPLTVRKPADWDLFTPGEIYERGTLWTAIRFRGRPIGLKLVSLGTIERPLLHATLYAQRGLSEEDKRELRSTIGESLGAEQDLRAFYSFAEKDPVLKHVIEDLYGMHDTQAVSLFNSVILSICLQMTRLARSLAMMEAINRVYGDTIEFDGRGSRSSHRPRGLRGSRQRSLRRSANWATGRSTSWPRRR